MHEKTGQLPWKVADIRLGTNFLIPQELDTDPPLRLRPLPMRQLQRQCQLLNLKPAPYVRRKSGQPCTFRDLWRGLQPGVNGSSSESLQLLLWYSKPEISRRRHGNIRRHSFPAKAYLTLPQLSYEVQRSNAPYYLSIDCTEGSRGSLVYDRGV